MISKKAKYALKALKHLGIKFQDKKPTLISQIAEAENIPRKFLEAILVELRNNGLLESRKGKGGGYLLRFPPEEITFAKVLRIIDGPIAPLLCVSLNFYGQCEDCTTEETCNLRPILGQVRDANLAVYEKNTVADLIK